MDHRAALQTEYTAGTDDPPSGDNGRVGRPFGPAKVDLDRIGLWGAQLILDAGAEDLEGVRSDNFAVDYARERMVGGVPDETVNELNATLDELQIAIDDEDFGAIAEAAQAIRGLAGDIGS